MGLSTGFGVSQKQEPVTIPPPAPPFALTSADNGLSVDAITGVIALGNDAMGAAGPAQLISRREIALQTFDLTFIDFLSADPVAMRFVDNFIQLQRQSDNSTGEMRFDGFSINDNGTGAIFNIELTNGTGIASLQNGTAPMLAFDLNSGTAHMLVSFDVQDASANRLAFFDTTNSKSLIGDVDSAVTGAQLKIDALTGIVVITSKIAGTPDLEALHIDGAMGTFQLGDLQIFGNGTALRLDDTTGTFDIASNVAAGPRMSINGVPCFSGTVSPVNSITVVGGLVTAVS